jgi:hypothetical protein
VENIENDLHLLIDEYMQDKGGDITPMQQYCLDALIKDLASLLEAVANQNVID